MENQIFVPKSDQEKQNCEALKEYLSGMFFC